MVLLVGGPGSCESFKDGNERTTRVGHFEGFGKFVMGSVPLGM